MKSRKMVLMNLFAGKNEDADIENKLVDIAREGEGGKTEKVALTYIYIVSCVKQLICGNLLYKTGSPAWRPVMT